MKKKCSNFKPTNSKLIRLVKHTFEALNSKKSLHGIIDESYFEYCMLKELKIKLPNNFFDYIEEAIWLRAYHMLIHNYSALLIKKAGNFRPTNKQLIELVKITLEALKSKRLRNDVRSESYINIARHMLEELKIELPNDFFDYPEEPEWLKTYGHLIYDYIVLLDGSDF